MKRFSSICLLLTTLLLVGCNGSQKPKTQLTLSASSLTMVANGEDKVTFTVKDQVGQDYTTKATFKVNDQKIDKPEWTTSTPGEYTVVAFFGDNKSNEIKIVAREAGAKITAIVLKVDKTIVLADGVDKITLKAHDAANPEGEALSDVIFFADGKKLDGNTFSTKTVGEVKLKAQYKELVSPEVAVSAVTDDGFTPTAHVLLEDWTGTWCPYCPRAHVVIEDAIKDPEGKFISLAYHVSYSSTQGIDPFDVVRLIAPLYRKEGIGGFPTIRANRTYNAVQDYAKLKGQFKDLKAELGITLSVKLDNGKVVADYSVRRKNTFAPSGELKVAVALYENDLHADQANAVFPEKGNPIRNLQFDRILRAYKNDNPLGDAFKFGGEHIYTAQHAFSMDSSWTLNNCGVAVIVLDDKGRVLNAQSANVGESKGY